MSRKASSPSPVLLVFLILPLLGIFIALMMVTLEERARPTPVPHLPAGATAQRDQFPGAGF